MNARSKRRKTIKVKSDATRTAHVRTVNKNIIRLREERDISRDQLAGELGVSTSAIAKWESGYAAPSIARLPDVAAALGVSVDELLAEAS